jgi:predicted DNA-binding transcriptional regulator YafY
MAKDTEKLIRQLSLISYLMAERRPVTALDIKRDVEGYSGMNEDAFARRFYADRSELESLRIPLTVEKPIDGLAEQENYSLRPENFHLPAIAFTDAELAALATALSLLDGEFAYAEPLRLALQQVTWGRPSPLAAPDQQSVQLGITASAGGHELSQRLVKIETAIFRHKTIAFDYYTMERDAEGSRKVDPYHLLFRGGQFYLLGYSHERSALRVFRLSRIRGKVSYATKAEHDFKRPLDFDPRAYANRAEWQTGEAQATAEILIAERVAWQVERHFGRYGKLRPAAGDGAADGDRVFSTDYGNSRLLLSWLLGLGENARVLGPPELVADLDRRVELIVERHGESAGPPSAAELLDPASRPGPAAAETNGDHGTRAAARDDTGGEARGEARSGDTRQDSAIRPERFARLVTLASILIQAGRAERRLELAALCERLQISELELREDVSVLNVVNFGGGSYVLYAEVSDVDGTIDVDPQPYSDNFDRPARLLPVEAKALVAAIDLIGEHIPEGSLTSAREKIVAALGEDPMEQGLQVAGGGGDDSGIARVVSKAIVSHQILELDYYKENEDEFSQRRVEPYALMNGQQGWYVATYDPSRQGMRHFRLDRIRRAEVSDEHFEPRPEVNPSADVEGWPRTGEVPASATARVWISPDRARWAREQRKVVDEYADGSITVELSFAGTDWLVREVLKEAGDAAVLEPVGAREAVLAAVKRLR